MPWVVAPVSATVGAAVVTPLPLAVVAVALEPVPAVVLASMQGTAVGGTVGACVVVVVVVVVVLVVVVGLHLQFASSQISWQLRRRASRLRQNSQSQFASTKKLLKYFKKI